MTFAQVVVKYTAGSMSPTPDPSRCPLCGAQNRCAVAAGAAASTCWCMRTELASEVLARVPAAARDQACVCAACARNEPAATTLPLRTLQ